MDSLCISSEEIREIACALLPNHVGGYDLLIQTAILLSQ